MSDGFTRLKITLGTGSLEGELYTLPRGHWDNPIYCLLSNRVTWTGSVYLGTFRLLKEVDHLLYFSRSKVLECHSCTVVAKISVSLGYHSLCPRGSDSRRGPIVRRTQWFLAQDGSWIHTAPPLRRGPGFFSGRVDCGTEGGTL